MSSDLTFYEFFAGGGLARIGLGGDWTCLFANDISKKKAEVYRANFPLAREFLVADIHDVSTCDIPGGAALAWASFPCQDLSLAGNGRGLRAERSGTFWPFWLLVTALEKEGRGSPIIVLENVVGLLTSNKGKDFQELLNVLMVAGYRFGALVIDAVHFVPQSRPRLFIVAVKLDQFIQDHLIDNSKNSDVWHPKLIINAYNQLPRLLQDSWIWWNLPVPTSRVCTLRDLIDDEPQGVKWHTKEETDYILSLMSPVNLAKVRRAQQLGSLEVGTVYKRIRVEEGIKKQRAEVRFDGISGCLRTPIGGSSRQIIMVVKGASVASRLLSVREAARLMGLPEQYQLPNNYNDGYHVMGDAVVVPVVSWLEKHLLRPLALSLLKGEMVER
ncbi:MAG TPA: DNA cytosine methyltransferase [Roseiflexaceae bacterium]|jgi:DNA (cytosine-5)-methyltransferase 1|nr:DNA cytosine methyltransferase [Roseiflexaceae bacterium]